MTVPPPYSPFRYRALEVAIGEGVIFDVNGQALVRGIEAGSLGDRPAFEGAVHLKTEVVMKPSCRVLLDKVRISGGSL
jgi:hypothetical protein